MQPFRIICETCHSRLKIRSPEVIGEIHACPKCGSMVHIVPPAGWQADGPSSESAPPGMAQEAALAMSATASLIIPASAVAELGAAPDMELQSVEAAPSAAPGSSSAISPLVMWTLGGVAGCLIGGLALAFWPGRGDTAENASSSPAAAPVKTGLREQPESTPASPAAVTEQPKAALADPYAIEQRQNTPQANSEATGQPPAEPGTTDSKPDVVRAPSSATPSPEAVAKATPTTPTAEPSNLVEPAAKNSEHQPVLKIDPLDFDPNRLSLNAKSPAGEKTTTSSVPDQPPNAEPTNDVVAAANNAAVHDNLSSQHDSHPSVTVRRGQPPAESAALHKPGPAFATKVKSLQLVDVPMTSLIDTLSGLAGTGITLDPIALELVGHTPKTTVSIDAQDATPEKILRDALMRKRLDLIVQGDQVRVVLPKSDERRAADYDVKDLVSGTDATEVAGLFERFVAPETWRDGGAANIQVNGTTLHIEQSDRVHRQIVIFCERLRLARGLALRSKYPAALLSAEPAYQRLSPKLIERTTFTFLPWTRLADVIRQWQELSGLTILVDWSALAEAELTRTSPVACSVIDRTWKESLDGVLEPLGLGWWAVDGETIQITSLPSIEKIKRAEFYQVPDEFRQQFATSTALIDSLQKQIGERSPKQSKLEAVRIEVDEPSGRLIVLASPGTHRYLNERLAAKR